MTISLNDFFNNSFILTDQEFRYQLIKKIFDWHGLNMTAKPYLGYWFNILSKGNNQKIAGMINCFYAHIALINIAKIFNMPYIVIFEDDAYPCYNIKNKLEYYLKDIPDDADCIRFGYTKVFNTDHKLYNNKFKKITTQVWGMHAYIIFKSAYNKFINKKFQQKNTLNYYYFNIDLNTYIPKENLFIQYNDSKSYLGTTRKYLWHNMVDDQIFQQFPKIEEIFPNKNELSK